MCVIIRSIFSDDSRFHLYIGLACVSMQNAEFSVMSRSLIQIKDGIFGIFQLTKNDEIFSKQFVFKSISNLLLNTF